MKFKFLHIIFLLFLTFGFSQEKTVKGYTIDGDDIVFTFDKRDYESGTLHKTQERFDFSEFDIKNVVVAGNFNKWSVNKWKMTRVDENTYQLRKKIANFDQNFNWEFKFIVNNSIWAEPSSKMKNITPIDECCGFGKHSYNFTIMPYYVAKNGNAKFFLEGHQNAKKVILAGSFNKWDENLYKMIKTKKGWVLDLQLAPGTYEYKFIVDGNWTHDLANKKKALNEYAGYNSIIEITKKVTFLVEDFNNAEKVILSGSFNNWAEDKYEMIKTKDGWRFTTELVGGKYHYKFIVDGVWKVDPNNPIKEYDWDGNINSVKMVK